MNMKKFLFLADVKEVSLEHLSYALSFAEIMGAEIHICYVSHTLETSKIKSSDIHPLAVFYNTKTLDEDETAFKAYENKIKGSILDYTELLDNAKFHFLKDNFEDAVNNLCIEQKIDLVIVKTNTDGKLYNFFYHSYTIDLLNTIKTPLLILPKNTTYQPIKKVAVASLLRGNESSIISKMHQLFNERNINFNCIYFTDSEPNLPANFNNVQLDIVKGSSFEKGIKDYLVNNNINIIGTFHRHLAVWKRLFEKNHTESLIYQIQVPILVLHSN